jgi:indolepyruvate ferredoxin oxidoreductase
MVGKYDSHGEPLIPWTGELSPLQLVPVVAARLDAFFPEEGLPAKAKVLTDQPPQILNVPGATRTPYFCSGCPHNTSTKVPEGSKANSGIGCHVMASWMNRNTAGYAQMGGEGVPHVVASQFNGGKHVFQNLGEGTWYHSGSLAIRQAVAAGTNITYKILYNDAVAMTGGQPVDGPVSVQGIAQTCRAEGVQRIALVSDNITKFSRGDFPDGTTFHDRAEMDSLQRELREVPGVSALIYEQTCATEKRRRRKRGKMENPKKFVMINDLVCEGCGDCSVESNCLSVEPKETPFGRKRKINLSSCNKDYSCLNGFCPSFVTIEGAERKKKQPKGLDAAALTEGLPMPDLKPLDAPFDLMVTGVGGTGVVTVGALITMAAHLEGKGSSVLDFTGFAQKFGTVLSYIRLARTPEAVNQVRIEQGAADAVIACDVVVSSAPKASVHYRAGTKVALNRAEMPTGDLVLRRDADLKAGPREAAIAAVVGSANIAGFNANAAAEALLGDAVLANVMMLGFAWQQGLVPVSAGALDQAIVLNSVAIEKNRLAFAVGRTMAAAPEQLADHYGETPEPEETLEQIIARRVAFLTGYEDVAYGEAYRARLKAFRAALPVMDATKQKDLLTAAAKSLFKLMAVKDEYEVARLLTGEGFRHQIAEEFGEDAEVKYHLAPPLLALRKDARGRPVKQQYGAWLAPALRLLARGKRLRRSRLNPFAHHAEARMNQALKDWYEGILARAESRYSDMAHTEWLEVLNAPMEIRGYGPVRLEAAKKVQEETEASLKAL